MRGIALLLAGIVAATGLTGIEARAATATGQAEPPAGLGVEIIVDKGVVKVVTPFDDGPAAKAGVMAGDVITHVDDVPLQHLPRPEVIDKLRGPANTTARLRLIRTGQNKPVELSIVREPIRIPSVRTRQDGDDIGYVRIAAINEQTMDQLTRALGELSSRIPPDKLKGYVLDLRNTPPSERDPAIALADAFLDSGEIVSVRGRDPSQIERFSAKPGDLINGKPLVVLINGGSASGAEIVAGALQDHKRAKIVGSHSFGDASVQSVIPLGGGHGAIRLTTGRYFTPAGRSFHGTGIVPDVEASQDSPPTPDNDQALTAAYKLLREGNVR
jgi:carboxyl-terminal processing protease